MKKYADFTFKVVANVIFEVLFAFVLVVFALTFTPKMYNVLVAENMESNVAVAVVSVVGIVAAIVIYRVMDFIDKEFNNLMAKIRKSKELDRLHEENMERWLAKYDTNNQKTRSGSNELTHEHNA